MTVAEFSSLCTFYHKLQLLWKLGQGRILGVHWSVPRTGQAGVETGKLRVADDDSWIEILEMCLVKILEQGL